jgi:geranylgeranyl pyrophosphate synthase
MGQDNGASGPASLIGAALTGVEEILKQASYSEVEALREAAQHILEAGGKRLRPRLTLLSALAAGGCAERAIPLAAACELVHTATLVHDDIVDESDSRRGRMAVRFFFGNSASVLMGDFLVVRAFSLIAADPERRLWTLLADTIARMCEGEVLQLCVRGDTAVTSDVYETIIGCKTALLMSTCCRFGGLVGPTSPETVETLGRFGHQLGMAFQIQDDILDFTGDEAVLGKPVGSDLRERKVTLPVILALEQGDAATRDHLLELYSHTRPLTGEETGTAIGMIAVAGGFERARRHALDYVLQARRTLEALPSGPARDCLERLSQRAVDRTT